MLRQLQLGMTDMALHYGFDPNGSESPFDIERRVLSITSLLPPLPESRFCVHSDIFSPADIGGILQLQVGGSFSADAFGAFEDAGLDDEKAVAETGRRFRDTVLAQAAAVTRWISFAISEAANQIRMHC